MSDDNQQSAAVVGNLSMDLSKPWWEGNVQVPEVLSPNEWLDYGYGAWEIESSKQVTSTVTDAEDAPDMKSGSSSLPVAEPRALLGDFNDGDEAGLPSRASVVLRDDLLRCGNADDAKGEGLGEEEGENNEKQSLESEWSTVWSSDSGTVGSKADQLGRPEFEEADSEECDVVENSLGEVESFSRGNVFSGDEEAWERSDLVETSQERELSGLHEEAGVPPETAYLPPPSGKELCDEPAGLMSSGAQAPGQVQDPGSEGVVVDDGRDNANASVRQEGDNSDKLLSPGQLACASWSDTSPIVPGARRCKSRTSVYMSCPYVGEATRKDLPSDQPCGNPEVPPSQMRRFSYPLHCAGKLPPHSPPSPAMRRHLARSSPSRFEVLGPTVEQWMQDSVYRILGFGSPVGAEQRSRVENEIQEFRDNVAGLEKKVAELERELAVLKKELQTSRAKSAKHKEEAYINAIALKKQIHECQMYARDYNIALQTADDAEDRAADAESRAEQMEVQYREQMKRLEAILQETRELLEETQRELHCQREENTRLQEEMQQRTVMTMEEKGDLQERATRCGPLAKGDSQKEAELQKRLEEALDEVGRLKRKLAQVCEEEVGKGHADEVVMGASPEKDTLGSKEVGTQQRELVKADLENFKAAGELDGLSEPSNNSRLLFLNRSEPGSETEDYDDAKTVVDDATVSGCISDESYSRTKDSLSYEGEDDPDEEEEVDLKECIRASHVRKRLTIAAKESMKLVEAVKAAVCVEYRKRRLHENLQELVGLDGLSPEGAKMREELENQVRVANEESEKLRQVYLTQLLIAERENRKVKEEIERRGLMEELEQKKLQEELQKQMSLDDWERMPLKEQLSGTSVGEVSEDWNLEALKRENAHLREQNWMLSCSLSKRLSSSSDEERSVEFLLEETIGDGDLLPPSVIHEAVLQKMRREKAELESMLQSAAAEKEKLRMELGASVDHVREQIERGEKMERLIRCLYEENSNLKVHFDGLDEEARSLREMVGRQARLLDEERQKVEMLTEERRNDKHQLEQAINVLARHVEEVNHVVGEKDAAVNWERRMNTTLSSRNHGQLQELYKWRNCLRVAIEGLRKTWKSRACEAHLFQIEKSILEKPGDHGSDSQQEMPPSVEVHHRPAQPLAKNERPLSPVAAQTQIVLMEKERLYWKNEFESLRAMLLQEEDQFWKRTSALEEELAVVQAQYGDNNMKLKTWSKLAALVKEKEALLTTETWSHDDTLGRGSALFRREHLQVEISLLKEVLEERQLLNKEVSMLLDKLREFRSMCHPRDGDALTGERGPKALSALSPPGQQVKCLSPDSGKESTILHIRAKWRQEMKRLAEKLEDAHAEIARREKEQQQKDIDYSDMREFMSIELRVLSERIEELEQMNKALGAEIARLRLQQQSEEVGVVEGKSAVWMEDVGDLKANEPELSASLDLPDIAVEHATTEPAIAAGDISLSEWVCGTQASGDYVGGNCVQRGPGGTERGLRKCILVAKEECDVRGCVLRAVYSGALRAVEEEAQEQRAQIHQLPCTGTQSSVGDNSPTVQTGADSVRSPGTMDGEVQPTAQGAEENERLRKCILAAKEECDVRGCVLRAVYSGALRAVEEQAQEQRARMQRMPLTGMQSSVGDHNPTGQAWPDSVLSDGTMDAELQPVAQGAEENQGMRVEGNCTTTEDSPSKEEVVNCTSVSAEATVKDLRAQNEQLEQDVIHMRTVVQERQNQVEVQEQENERLHVELKRKEQECNDLRTVIRDCEKQVAEEEHEKERLHEELKRKEGEYDALWTVIWDREKQAEVQEQEKERLRAELERKEGECNEHMNTLKQMETERAALSEEREAEQREEDPESVAAGQGVSRRRPSDREEAGCPTGEDQERMVKGEGKCEGVGVLCKEDVAEVTMRFVQADLLRRQELLTQELPLAAMEAEQNDYINATRMRLACLGPLASEKGLLADRGATAMLEEDGLETEEWTSYRRSSSPRDEHNLGEEKIAELENQLARVQVRGEEQVAAMTLELAGLEKELLALRRDLEVRDDRINDLEQELNRWRCHDDEVMAAQDVQRKLREREHLLSELAERDAKSAGLEQELLTTRNHLTQLEKELKSMASMEDAHRKELEALSVMHERELRKAWDKMKQKDNLIAEKEKVIALLATDTGDGRRRVLGEAAGAPVGRVKLDAGSWCIEDTENWEKNESQVLSDTADLQGERRGCRKESTAAEVNEGGTKTSSLDKEKRLRLKMEELSRRVRSMQGALWAEERSKVAECARLKDECRLKIERREKEMRALYTKCQAVLMELEGKEKRNKILSDNLSKSEREVAVLGDENDRLADVLDKVDQAFDCYAEYLMQLPGMKMLSRIVKTAVFEDAEDGEAEERRSEEKVGVPASGSSILLAVDSASQLAG
ncbi:hypothetical protein CBR_g36451 [Chara braunii]|uniref:Uncharacterized protein n=1 Tax=Chara braunii TaxID=69332 RepID=A0A388LKU2_CHABU|nr:hypothetical protein CBR_g36451 [Chara braunii]|eukprot:GBG82924.1 hypothetical protein CBR_g36451 [Chara braunii]